MIVLHATFPLDPDSRAEALDFVADLVDASQDEDGTVEYRATTEVCDPNTLCFFERYEDEAALEAHTETEHFGAFAAAIGDWLAGEPRIYRFDVDSMTELEL